MKKKKAPARRAAPGPHRAKPAAKNQRTASPSLKAGPKKKAAAKGRAPVKPKPEAVVAAKTRHERAAIEAVAAVDAPAALPLEPVVPARAPVRKVIRDGKAMPFENSQKIAEFLRSELASAYERFVESAAPSAFAARSLREFWAGDVSGMPAALDGACGEIAQLGLEALREKAGRDDSVIRAIIESLHRAASAAVEVPPEADQKKALRASVPVEPAWRPNEKRYGAALRAFFGLVEWQCKLAAAWPFAFARFMARIPQRMGSDEFGALALAVDRGTDAAAELLGVDPAEVGALVERGREQIAALFESESPDLERQWNIALRGSGVVVDHLIQRYVVDSLNREFQMLLGRMLVLALGGAALGDGGGARANDPLAAHM